MSQEADRRAERAHGDVIRCDGDMATLGDGSQWWLNGTAWARSETDAVIARDLHRGRGVRISTT